METSAEGVQEALVEFRATLQAAVREVHVDVSAFKQRIEQRIEELCISNGPLAEAVSRLQEENLQLRAKLEALSLLVEGLAAAKAEKSPAEVKGKDGEMNGHAPIQSKEQEDQRGLSNAGRSESGLSRATNSDPPGSTAGSGHATAQSNAPAPAPWRTRRHAEINVSIVGPHVS